MVLQRYFQDIFASLPHNKCLSLPASKQNHLEIDFDKDVPAVTVFSGSEPPLPFASSVVYNAGVSSWRRLAAEDKACKAVYEVTLDVQDSNLVFKAGDTIGIIPQNDETDVNAVITHLDLTAVADCNYKLSLNTSSKGSKVPAHIPNQSSLRHVFTHCVDLRSVLKKLFLLALSRYTKDDNEKKILEYFCSKEGSAAYQTHILNTNLCILDLFVIFKSCKPPVSVLLANLPRLLPRPYSIVNSGNKEPKLIKICFSVMHLENNRKGLTTGWLEKNILNKEYNLEKRLSNLKITNDCDMDLFNVPIYLRKNLSGFNLPDCVETPLILIGPGTGVAPFIGFLQERESHKNDHPDIIPGEIWLFFGCRNPELDFIYKKELEEFVQNGVLKKLCTAFSRVDNCDTKYIQDALKQNSEEIVKLIQCNASIFICGDLKTMAAQVQDTFKQCLVSSGKSADEANNIITDLQKKKKYIVDVWS